MSSATSPLDVRTVRCPNLFDLRSRSREDVPWRPGITVADVGPTDWPPDRSWAILGGERLPPERWGEIALEPGGEVLFACDPRGVETALLAAGLSAWLASAIAFVINLGIYYGLSALAQKLIGPPDAGDLGDSPTYSFGPYQMTTRNGQPIAVAYGQHRISGQLLQVVPRKDRSGDDVLRLLVGLCEGPVQEIAGQTSDFDALKGPTLPEGIFVNGNDATDLIGIAAWGRLGTLDQGPIPGFRDIIQITEADITLASGDPVTITTSTSVDSFEVVFYHPEGVYKTDGRSGKVESEWIAYTARWRVTGEVSWREEEYVAWAAKKTAPFTSHYRNDNPRTVLGEDAILDIQIEQETFDSDYRHHRTVNWLRTFEIQRGKGLSYPHIALIAVDVPAQAEANGSLPVVSVDGKWKKFWTWDPDDLDPETTTLTHVYSANPAQVLFDFILHKRYGGGDIFELCSVDLQSFDDWRQYCDELVDDLSGSATTAARWAIGLVIDQLQGFWKVAAHIASLGRAQLILDGRRVRVKIERASDPVQLISVGNIERDSLEIQYLARADRPNSVEVQFLNAERGYDHDMAPLEDPDRLTTSTPVRKQTVQMFGLTAQWRAYRAAQYLLNIARLLLTQIQFRAGIDQVALEAGDVFAFQHDLPDWDSAIGGRTLAASGVATVFLDRELTIGAAEVWRVWVRTSGSGADVVQDRQITALAGTYAAGDEIAVASDWDSGDRPVRGDVFAAVLTNGTETIREFRVTYTALDPKTRMRSISAIEYDADVYDDTPPLTVAFGDEGPLDPGAIPPNPTQLTLSESGGGLDRRIDVSWIPASWEWEYPFRVYWRDVTEGQEAFGLAGETTSSVPFLSIDATGGHTYTLSVVPGAADGGLFRDPDNGLIGTITLDGAGLFPDDVTALVAVQSGDYVELTWTGVDLDENDVQYYEVWRGRSWHGRRILARTTETSLQTTDWCVGADYFGVRVRNYIGRYSEVPQRYALTLAIPTGESSDLSRDEVGLSWPGTLSNVVVNGDGYLELDSGQTGGTYTSPDLNLTTLATYRLGILRQSEQDDLSFTWDSAALTWADLGATTWDATTYTWGGTAPTWDSAAGKRRAWSGQIEEDPTSVAIHVAFDLGAGFGDWQPFVPGSYSFQQVKFRLTLSRDSATDYQVAVDTCLTTVSS